MELTAIKNGDFQGFGETTLLDFISDLAEVFEVIRVVFGDFQKFIPFYVIG